MVLKRDDVRSFAQFLREEFDVKPVISVNDGDELLRAVIGTRLVIVLGLNMYNADVWCSDKEWASELSMRWQAHAMGKRAAAAR